MENGEFKVLEGPSAEVQKKLNQWRHQFHLTIHKVHFETSLISPEFNMAVLVERKPK
ncbi:hypothetical protein [Marisediminitalea sp.]|uniref:hypothetical protein n=1 Tax=Marisediminitalea sp. TaxID=2662268 RepID=UPI003519D7A1